MPHLTPRLRKERKLGLGLVAVGLFLLPPAVYWVGQRVVGEYAAEGGLWTLAKHLWSDLAAGSPLGWLLVLSPYAIVQAARLARTLWRGYQAEKHVTV